MSSARKRRHLHGIEQPQYLTLTKPAKHRLAFLFIFIPGLSFLPPTSHCLFEITYFRKLKKSFPIIREIREILGRKKEK
jgi:hypothetical protein